MAYETTNPPICIVPRVGSGPAVWLYSDGDAIGTVVGAGYFSNGEALGMKALDLVFVIVTGSFTSYNTVVSAVSTTATVTTDPTIN